MKFAFEILWTRNGFLEPLFEPAPVNLRSVKTARALAERFASYAPVHSITIEAEDGSIFERWSWLNDAWGQHDPLEPPVAPMPAPSLGSATDRRP
ncbi:MAG: hypothetical protein WB697_07080 [Stellaceae bacterium]